MRRIYNNLMALLMLVSLFSVSNLHAQVSDHLGRVRVEELTDDQIRRFVTEATRMGISDLQIEEYALSRGMNPIEVVRLRERMQLIRKSLTSAPSLQDKRTDQRTNDRPLTDSTITRERNPSENYSNLFSLLVPANFGFELFNNTRLTFEPDLRIPTPTNYRLAAGDELIVDVSGLSEANYRMSVSREGIIRIPVAGPVNVNGLTIEEAKRIIRKKLSSTIYTSIKNGQTTVDVTLGAIRSIRVTIIGEAVLPGTFTLPSLATAFHALYACGGPNANGTLRNVKVIRNNVTVAEIDVYDYLVNGTKKNDIRLMDHDVIKISGYSLRVELKGEVKRPGFYDALENEPLSKIISFAGGYTDLAYTEKIQVFKNTAKERKIATISDAQTKTMKPERGDSYVIGRILNRFSNRISIKGAVFRPGEFELKQGMTLLTLIEEADGLREDAFTSRGNIHRLKKDLSPEIISFDLDKIRNGASSDIVLQAEDKITVFSKFDIKEGYYITIDGEIASPGYYLFEEGMKIQDIILIAGGLKESSSAKRIEISRRVKNADPQSVDAKTALVFQQDIPADYRDSIGTSDFILLPFDEISIRPAPGYSPQKNVVIEGEVIYTGKYTLDSKNNRISDLITRSGGLTPYAYLQGAVLVRSRNLSKTEQANAQQGLQNLVKQNLLSGTPSALVENQISTELTQRSQFVGIDLEKILNDPGSKYDLFLYEGDTLRIPKQLQTIRISGEVLFPTIIRYDKQLSFKDYIHGAGGFSERSLRKRSYVVHANGAVQGTKSFLFFKNYPSVKPGDEIFVPIRRERERLRTGEMITIGATLVSMIAILATLL